MRKDLSQKKIGDRSTVSGARKERVLSGGYGVSEKAPFTVGKPAPNLILYRIQELCHK